MEGKEGRKWRERRGSKVRCKSRGNKSSIQCHKNKCALYRGAENLFKSSPWRNPTKVKISCLYSLPYPVSPHTNASFLCCMKSQTELAHRFNKNGTRRLSHIIYMWVISPHVMCGPFSCLLPHPKPVCPLLGFILQAPANHSFHIPLPMRFWLVWPRKYVAMVVEDGQGKRKKPKYFLSLPSLEAMSPAVPMPLPQPQLLPDMCPLNFLLYPWWPWLLGSGSTISSFCPSSISSTSSLN